MKTEDLIGFRKEIRDYFCILSKEMPDFLMGYIETLEMQRLKGISIFCGTDYTSIFHNRFFYSTLEHSIGVALILWHFTKDKKQTIAGLFHDIATPSFKHCIDFLYQDYEKQEATEQLTTQRIQNSPEIVKLLKRDGLTIEEVDDYKKYPIADNDTPKLSADRLEYTFTNGLSFYPIWQIEDIKKLYQDIVILENEDKLPELGFKTLEIAEEYISCASQLWPEWISNRDKLVMQFFADIIKEMIEQEYLTQEQLYELAEQEIIEKIKKQSNPRIATKFETFENTTQIGEGQTPVEKQYCVSITSKRRYIIPLVQTKQGIYRIHQISSKAKECIDTYLAYQTPRYAYIDLEETEKV